MSWTKPGKVIERVDLTSVPWEVISAEFFSRANPEFARRVRDGEGQPWSKRDDLAFDLVKLRLDFDGGKGLSMLSICDWAYRFTDTFMDRRQGKLSNFEKEE